MKEEKGKYPTSGRLSVNRDFLRIATKGRNVISDPIGDISSS